MNAGIFRLIFSKRLGMLVPMAETSTANRKSAAGETRVSPAPHSGEAPRPSATPAGFLIKPLALFVALAIGIPFAQANPTNPTVVSGSASFNQAGNTLTVTNTPNAIINWGSFSVGQNELTRFVQQNSASAVLNRVTGQDPSQILGQLQSNGRVFIINPNGVLFGQGAKIDVAGLVASSLNISNEDFLSGKMRFIGNGAEGAVKNAGDLTTPGGGQIILIAPNVENTGIITSPNGEIILAAGHTVELADTLNPALRVEITAPEGEALNLGTLIAEGGKVGMYAGIVKQSGKVSATSAVAEGGRIFLKGRQAVINETSASLLADGGTTGGTITLDAAAIAAGGTISAKGVQHGGTIHVDAGSLSHAGLMQATSSEGQGGSIDIAVRTTALHNVYSKMDASGATGGSIREVAAQQITSSGTYTATGSSGPGGQIDLTAPATKLLSAQLDASGATGGGQVRVGGEYQGGKNLTQDELPNAETLAVSAGTTIKADATEEGAGGTVILWSETESMLFPAISASGTSGYSGGFVELSSANKISWGGTVNAGLGGHVLFDPKNILIDSAAAGGIQYSLILGYNYIDLPRLTGRDLEPGDLFGLGLSLYSGELLAIGASGDDGSSEMATDSGAVYLFSSPYSTPALSGIIGKGYTGAGNINVNTLEPGDQFGIALSLSGTQLAVGAKGDDGFGNAVTDSGAVYLFNDPLGAPILSGIIGKGYTGAGNFDVGALELLDNFGVAVSLSGAKLVVGADNDDGFGNAVNNGGAVYLFSNPYSTPVLSGVIGNGYTGTGDYNLSELEDSDHFGVAVSLSGTQLAVGADVDNGFGNAALDSGAVYLFSDPYSTPILSGVIGKGYTGAGNFDVSALEVSDAFGFAVSLSGTQLAVGAHLDDGSANAATDSGAVYLFNDPFGTTSLSGVIGKGYASAGNFDMDALEVGDNFGVAVSLSGTQLAVGAIYDAGLGNVSTDSGAVYLFNDPFGAASLSGIIGKGYMGVGSFDVSALEEFDNFGSAVSLSGTQLAVGAQSDSGADNSVWEAGAVYLFNDPYTTPSLSGVIGKGHTGAGNYDLSTLDAYDDFGVAVSLSGTQLVVGAEGDAGSGNTSPFSGAVYLFTNPFSTPTHAGTIGKGYTGAGDYNLNALEDFDDFGTSVSLSGTQLAVGALGDDGFGNSAMASGAVYLFNNPFGATALSGIIGKGYTGAGNFDVSALEEFDNFGSAVSLSGSQLAVAAFFDDGFGNAAADSGAVYLFNNPFGATALSGIIGKGYTGAGNFDLSALEANDTFGDAVSLSGTQLAVGASWDDGFGNAAADSGAVYLFNDPFGATALSGTIGKGYTGTGDYDLSALEAGDEFGYSVSLSGTQLAVGAYGDAGAGDTAMNSGAVYLFTLGGTADPATGQTFAFNPGTDSTITPDSITAILNTGSALTLQANNDITVNAAISANNPVGDGGDLTLQAGRSIMLNADIATDNGDLTLIANETPVNGVQTAYRDAGAAVITMAPGTQINAGTGSALFQLGTGDGIQPNNGTITLGAVNSGGAVLIQHQGSGDVLLDASIHGASIGVSTGGNILDNGQPAVLDTSGANGPISLTAASIGASGSGNYIAVNQGSGTVSATSTTGGIYLEQAAGDVSSSKYTFDAPAGNEINLAADTGSLTIDGNLSYVNNLLGFISLQPGANMSIAPTVTITAGDVAMESAGNLILDGQIIAGGEVHLASTTGDILVNEAITAGGAVTLDAANDINLNAGLHVALSAPAFLYLDAFVGDINLNADITIAGASYAELWLTPHSYTTGGVVNVLGSGAARQVNIENGAMRVDGVMNVQHSLLGDAKSLDVSSGFTQAPGTSISGFDIISIEQDTGDLSVGNLSTRWAGAYNPTLTRGIIALTTLDGNITQQAGTTLTSPAIAAFASGSAHLEEANDTSAVFGSAGGDFFFKSTSSIQVTYLNNGLPPPEYFEHHGINAGNSLRLTSTTGDIVVGEAITAGGNIDLNTPTQAVLNTNLTLSNTAGNLAVTGDLVNNAILDLAADSSALSVTGLLTNNSGKSILLNGDSASLQADGGIDNQGSLEMLGVFTYLETSGNFTNSGSLLIENEGFAWIDQNLVNNSGGTVTVQGDYSELDINGNLINAGSMNQGGNVSQIVVYGDMDNQPSGSIEIQGENHFTIVNSVFNNAGSLIASGGGVIDATQGVNNNATGSIEVTGQVVAGPSSELNSGDLFTNAGSLTISDTGYVLAPAGLTNQAAGTVQVQTGGTLDSSSIDNAASIVVDGTSFVYGDYFDNTGTFVHNGELWGLTLTLNGGTLQGVGTLHANVINNSGIVFPGNSAGTMTIDGDYSQGAGGMLDIEIGGTGAGEFDVLAVSGNVTLDGTLNASLINGFIPANADSFAFLTAVGTATGTFATLNAPANFSVGYSLAAGEAARLIYSIGTTNTFTNADGGLTWGTAGNWSLGWTPVSTDDVLISSGYAVTHGTGTDTIATLTVNSGNSLDVSGGSLTVTGATNVGGALIVSGGTVALDGASSIADLTLSSGNLSGTGTVTVTNAMTWTGTGQMGGSGTTVIDAGATLTLSGTSTKYLEATRTLTNLGTASQSGGAINSENAGDTGQKTINNAGSWTISDDSDVVFLNWTGNALVFNNSGTLTKSGGTATSIVDGLNNSGTVNVDSGRLVLQTGANGGSYTDTGIYNIASGASLEFSSGTRSINANGTTTFTGTDAIKGAGEVRFLGGTLTFTGAGSTNSSTALNLTVDSGPIVPGTITQPANGTVVNNGDGTFTYTPSGSFNGIDSFSFQVGDGAGNFRTATIDINVDLAVLLATWIGTSSGSWDNPANWQGGVVPVDGYAVSIPDMPGLITVTYSSSAGTTSLVKIDSSENLSLTGGTLNLGNTLADVSNFGSGTSLTVDGGTLGVNGALNANSLDLISGTISGSGSLSVAQGFSYSSGTMGSSFASLFINQATGDLILPSMGAVGDVTLVSAGDLTLDGQVTSSGGNIAVAAVGDFINNVGANALAAASGRWLVYAADPATSSFGGLDSGNKAIWGQTYASYNPAEVSQTGNRYLFAWQPTVSFSADNLAKTYGDDLTEILPVAYSVSGLHPGVSGAFLADTAADAYSGAPSVTSAGAAANASVAGSPYLVDIATGTLTALNGYQLALVDSSLTVDPLVVLLAGTRVYDATQTISGGDLSVSNLVAGDSVGLAGSGTLASKNVGDQAITDFGSLVLSSGNYTLGGATGSVAITPATLTVSATAEDKVYDGTTLATVNLLDDRFAADLLTLSFADAAFADSNAGLDKVVSVTGISLTGTDAGNYTFNASAVTSADITPAALTLSAVSDSKVYDGSIASSAAPNATGLVAGDSLSTLVQVFDSRDAGSRILSVSSYSIDDGNGGNNYVVATETAAGTITPAALTLSASSDSKVYDATTVSLAAPNVTGLVGGDTASGLAQEFDSRHAGSRILSVSNYSIDDGNGGNNYVVTTEAAVGSITPAPLSLAASGDSKIFDGTVASSAVPVASGLMGADTVSGLQQTFDSPFVGTRTLTVSSGYTIDDGNGGGNYVVSELTASGTILADPTNFAWTDLAGGAWEDGTNWNQGVAPASGSDVVLPATSGGVTFSSVSTVKTLTSASDFSVDGGSLTLGTAPGDVSVFSGAGLTVNAGSLLLDGSTLVSDVVVNGGTLGGAGTIDGNVNLGAATLAPGLPVGVLTISGDLSLAPTSTIAIDLQGETAGTGYDVVAVGGTANLDGTLLVSLSGGYLPAPSATFDFLTASSFTGAFASSSLPVGFELASDGTSLGVLSPSVVEPPPSIEEAIATLVDSTNLSTVSMDTPNQYLAEDISLLPISADTSLPQDAAAVAALFDLTAIDDPVMMSRIDTLFTQLIYDANTGEWEDESRMVCR